MAGKPHRSIRMAALVGVGALMLAHWGLPQSTFAVQITKGQAPPPLPAPSEPNAVPIEQQTSLLVEC
jgi:hypothetical protein